ncbi:hypothetical protein GLAREA_10227 [Glarea lozoyensis ATCC 20868]|uniref:GPI anchored serine-threonine rich protein n=1 Tax=Glarea lozoyensis (strain ATCC 20868 / MF5171) TaxID=1116229 RepID=S3E869_GLAL2|nr:uncharacterized protein GLAREA_10227 [Glarea lozoyensis ATCC 20868]EPE34533.1 hypothetical protein GLAREA_10227 [Glarea lozoyensis ATCC 20868]
MHTSTLLPLTFLLTLTTAQTTLSAGALPSSTACAAKGVFDACLVTGNGYLASCSSQDWGCLCQKWDEILTCYLQCPNDPGQVGALSNKTTYCNQAAISPSSTSSAVSRAVSSDPVSSATQGVNGASPTTTGGAAGTTASEAAVRTAQASATGSGADRVAVGLGAGLLGLVAAVL